MGAWPHPRLCENIPAAEIHATGSHSMHKPGAGMEQNPAHLAASNMVASAVAGGAWWAAGHISASLTSYKKDEDYWAIF